MEGGGVGRTVVDVCVLSMGIGSLAEEGRRRGGQKKAVVAEGAAVV